jgi:DNA adenine methylase
LYLALWRVLECRGALADACHPLILTYQALARWPDAVISRLQEMCENHTEHEFLRVRDVFNSGVYPEGTPGSAARFLYLARSGFNGLWRVSRRTGYNTPWGNQPAAAVFRPDVLKAAAQAMSGCSFTHQDWRQSLAEADPGDFAYLDPPYDSLPGRPAFTAYSTPWSRQDTIALFACAREIADRGVQVMISNADTPFVRGLADGLPMRTVLARGSVGATGDSRRPRDELIITLGYRPRFHGSTATRRQGKRS